MSDASHLPLPAPASVLRHHGGVQAHPVMGELVLYDTAGNQALSLNGPGRSVWEALDGARSLEAVARDLAAGLGCGDDADAVAELLADVRSFAASLLDRGLVEPAAAPEA